MVWGLVVFIPVEATSGFAARDLVPVALCGRGRGVTVPAGKGAGDSGEGQEGDGE